MNIPRQFHKASFTLPAEPSRTEPIRLGKQTYAMKWKHSHCTPNRVEPNRTEPDRACSLVDVCFYSPAGDRFFLGNMSNFLGLKCVCTQKRLFLVNKRLLHQILSINENTSTLFDTLAVQKCQLQCFQLGAARFAMGIVTRSARLSSVRSGSAWIGSAYGVNEALRVHYRYEGYTNTIVSIDLPLRYRISSHMFLAC